MSLLNFFPLGNGPEALAVGLHDCAEPYTAAGGGVPEPGARFIGA